MRRQIGRSLLVFCFFIRNHPTLAFLLDTFKSQHYCHDPSTRGRRWADSMTTKRKAVAGDNSLPPLVIHHTAIKTRNITLATEFYSLLGFQVTTKFRAGPARAAWLELVSPDDGGESGGCRLELIEVPSFVLEEPAGMRRRAYDLMERQDLLGHNHLALDVTQQIAEAAAAANINDNDNQDSDEEESNPSRITDLTTWLQALNQTSIDTSNRMLRVALEPQQQMIGQGVFELAFLYDADGALIELLNKQSELAQPMASGWERWNGRDFEQEDD